MKNSLKNSKSDLIRLSLTLFLIAGIMALLVSLVNGVTGPVIEKRNEEKITQTLKSVMPEADHFHEYLYFEPSVVASDGKKVAVDGVWFAKKGGETVGCCVKVGPQGYGGKVETIVSFDLDGKVIDSQIVAMSETSGIGSKIQNEDFLSQVYGKKGAALKEVDVIGGATKSSKAYIRGVEVAAKVAEKTLGGEAN